MRHYELVVVLSPMMNQEQSSATWGRIKDYVGNQGGDITHEETWGTRRLAYAIKKGQHHFLEGSYYLTRFSAETPFNEALLTFLRLDEQVLRSLVTVTDPPGATPEPTPLARVAAPAEAPQPASAAAEEVAPAPAPAESAAAVAVAEAPPAATEEPAAETGGSEETQA